MPQDNPTISKPVTRQEFAERLGCCLETLRQLERAGRIPAPMNLGPRFKRWASADVEHFLSTGEVAR